MSPVNVARTFDSANRSDLARQLGVDRTHVSRVLGGDGVPSLAIAGELSRLMGVSLDEFYRQWVLRNRDKERKALAAA